MQTGKQTAKKQVNRQTDRQTHTETSKQAAKQSGQIVRYASTQKRKKTTNAKAEAVDGAQAKERP